MATETDFYKLRDQLTHELIIEDKIQETPDAYSFRFLIPSQLQKKYDYRAGQFVTLFLTVNGENLKRSYSLSTSPTVDSHFQITVKQVEGGRGSNFLANEVQKDSTLFVTPPQGTFFQPLDIGKNANYFFFAAGSGITPVFSILKETLKSDPSAKCHLLFANRDENHIIYKDLIDEVQKMFADRLIVRHQLSQPKEACNHRGRCDKAVIESFVEEYKSSDSLQAYICGPEGFMQSAKEGLTSAGFKQEDIRTESFASIVPLAEPKEATEDLDGIVIGDSGAKTASPEKIMAVINGEQIEVNVDPEMSILENLINAGQNPPYSCMDGACMACMAKVTSGKVVQDDYGILTEENVEQAETLTCQARAISKNVVIDYDSI